MTIGSNLYKYNHAYIDSGGTYYTDTKEQLKNSDEDSIHSSDMGTNSEASQRNAGENQEIGNSEKAQSRMPMYVDSGGTQVLPVDENRIQKENKMEPHLDKQAENKGPFDGYKKKEIRPKAIKGRLRKNAAEVYESSLRSRKEIILEKIATNKTLELKELWSASSDDYYDKLSHDEILNAIKIADRKIKEANKKFLQLKVKEKIEWSSQISKIYRILSTSPIKLTERISTGEGTNYLSSNYLVSPLGGGLEEPYSEKGNVELRCSGIHSYVVPNAIPKFEGQLRKAVSYRIAERIGFSDVVPPTAAALLTYKPSGDNIGFNYITDRLDLNVYPAFRNLEPFYERVCSVQKRILESDNVVKLLEEYLKVNQSATEGEVRELLEKIIPYHDFILNSLWLMITGDYDGNLGNFLIYKTHPRNTSYRLMKVDDEQAFPQLNRGFRRTAFETIPGFRNELIDQLSYSDQPIGEFYKQLIKLINIDQVLNDLKDFGLDNTVDATKVRLLTLKALLIEFPTITIRELYYRLSKIDPHAKSFSTKNNPVFSELSDKEKSDIPNYSLRLSGRVQEKIALFKNQIAP